MTGATQSTKQSAPAPVEWPDASQVPPGYVSLNEAIQRMCRRSGLFDAGGLPPVLKVDGHAYIDSRLHHTFLDPFAPDQFTDAFLSLPRHQQDRAVVKLRVLLDLDQFLKRHSRLGKCNAIDRFVVERHGAYTYQHRAKNKTLGLSSRGIRQWRRVYDDGGLVALASDDRGKGGQRRLSADAVALFRRLRANGRNRSVKDCFEEVRRNADANGWEWFVNASTCRRWVRDTQ